MFAQAGELTKVATDGAGTLMIQWGVAGVLVIVLIVGTSIMMRWFMNALEKQRTELMAINSLQRKDHLEANAAQRKENLDAQKELKESFLAALKEERETSERRHMATLKSHEEEMMEHNVQVKEWRTEAVTESRATRDMLQMWVSRMALARLEGDDGDPSKPRKSRSPA